jgi:hypothetical protein
MSAKLPLKWNDVKGTITEFEPGDEINVNALPSLTQFPDFSVAVATYPVQTVQRTHSDTAPCLWDNTNSINELVKYVIIRVAANTTGDITLLTGSDTASRVLRALGDGKTIHFIIDNTDNVNMINVFLPTRWVTRSRIDPTPVILQTKTEGGTPFILINANRIAIFSITRVVSATNQYAIIQSRGQVL